MPQMEDFNDNIRLMVEVITNGCNLTQQHKDFVHKQLSDTLIGFDSYYTIMKYLTTDNNLTNISIRIANDLADEILKVDKRNVELSIQPTQPTQPTQHKHHLMQNKQLTKNKQHTKSALKSTNNAREK